VFRIAQAALTNVARHARARVAALRLEVDEETGLVTLEVEDDGAGFQHAPTFQGIGIVAMRERAHGVGGELTVDSRPGGGTRVRAVIPMGRMP
jgi:signal transduction histidine kinase